MLKKKDIIAYTRYGDGHENFMDYYGYEDEITDEILEEIEKNGEYILKEDTYRNEKLVLKQNIKFEDEIIFNGFVRGCSSAQASFKKISSTERLYDYTMFLTDFEKLILEGAPVVKIKGIFTYVKRGRNYAIKLIKRTD